jgi:hypothetical protein
MRISHQFLGLIALIGIVGACVSPAAYADSGRIQITGFEGGLVHWGLWPAVR